MHNNDVLFEFFDGVSNHCASDRANNSSISAALFPCIRAKLSACAVKRRVSRGIKRRGGGMMKWQPWCRKRSAYLDCARKDAGA